MLGSFAFILEAHNFDQQPVTFGLEGLHIFAFQAFNNASTQRVQTLLVILEGVLSHVVKPALHSRTQVFKKMLETISATTASHGVRHQGTRQCISRTQAVGNASICIVVRLSMSSKHFQIVLTKIFCRKYTSADQRVRFTANGRLKTVTSESRNFLFDDNRLLVQRLVELDGSIDAGLVGLGMRYYFNERHQVWRVERMSDEDSAWVVCALSNELGARNS